MGLRLSIKTYQSYYEEKYYIRSFKLLIDRCLACAGFFAQHVRCASKCNEWSFNKYYFCILFSNYASSNAEEGKVTLIPLDDDSFLSCLEFDDDEVLDGPDSNTFYEFDDDDNSTTNNNEEEQDEETQRNVLGVNNRILLYPEAQEEESFELNNENSDPKKKKNRIKKQKQRENKRINKHLTQIYCNGLIQILKDEDVVTCLEGQAFFNIQIQNQCSIDRIIGPYKSDWESLIEHQQIIIYISNNNLDEQVPLEKIEDLQSYDPQSQNIILTFAFSEKLSGELCNFSNQSCDKHLVVEMVKELSTLKANSLSLWFETILSNAIPLTDMLVALDELTRFYEVRNDEYSKKYKKMKDTYHHKRATVNQRGTRDFNKAKKAQNTRIQHLFRQYSVKKHLSEGRLLHLELIKDKIISQFAYSIILSLSGSKFNFSCAVKCLNTLGDALEKILQDREFSTLALDDIPNHFGEDSFYKFNQNLAIWARTTTQLLSKLKEPIQINPIVFEGQLEDSEELPLDDNVGEERKIAKKKKQEKNLQEQHKGRLELAALLANPIDAVSGIISEEQNSDCNNNSKKKKKKSVNNNNDVQEQSIQTPEGSLMLSLIDSIACEEYLRNNFNSDRYGILDWILNGASSSAAPRLKKEATFELFGYNLIKTFKSFLVNELQWSEQAAQRLHDDALRHFKNSYHHYHNSGYLPVNYMHVRLWPFIMVGMFSEQTVSELSGVRSIGQSLDPYYKRLEAFLRNAKNTK